MALYALLLFRVRNIINLLTFYSRLDIIRGPDPGNLKKDANYLTKLKLNVIGE
jgi:hypothetical protein